MATAEQIKELRDKTGVSVMQCKKALEESGGDQEKAIEHLRSQGSDIAAKKGDRDLGAGAIACYTHGTKTIGAMVELNCETDFVAKNEEFSGLAYDIAMHVAAAKPQDVKELLEQDFIKDPSKKIGDLVQDSVQKFGENTVVRRFTRFSILED